MRRRRLPRVTRCHRRSEPPTVRDIVPRSPGIPCLGGACVRFSGLAGKEIINLRDGERLGHLGDCDLELDATGALTALMVPQGRVVGRTRRQVSIPWAAVRRIGSEVLIVDMAPVDLPKPWQRP